MSNVAISHISVAVNINFNHVKEFRGTKICRIFIFQRVWNEFGNENFFLRHSFTK